MVPAAFYAILSANCPEGKDSCNGDSGGGAVSFDCITVRVQAKVQVRDRTITIMPTLSVTLTVTVTPTLTPCNVFEASARRRAHDGAQL